MGNGAYVDALLWCGQCNNIVICWPPWVFSGCLYILRSSILMTYFMTSSKLLLVVQAYRWIFGCMKFILFDGKMDLAILTLIIFVNSLFMPEYGHSFVYMNMD